MRSSPVCRSHILSILSCDADTSQSSAGLTAAAHLSTLSSWPTSLNCSSLVSLSHTLTVPSSDPDTITFPDGLITCSSSQPVSPVHAGNLISSSSVCVSHILSVLSSEAETIQSPDELIAHPN